MLLVTGITGHTGKYFLQELINNKFKDTIRVVIRDTSDSSMLDNSGLKIEKFIGDITDKEFLSSCMRDIDTVMHIAGIQKSQGLMEAALNNGVQRAILVHTTGIYSKFKSASEEYKNIEIEIGKIVNKSEKLNVTILRPTMIYGDICDLNISKFIKMVDNLRIFPVIDKGHSLIQPVNARDLGKAYYQVLCMPVEVAKKEYVLSGEKPIGMIDAFKLISDNLNKKTVFISVPLAFGVFLAKSLKGVTIGKVDYIERVQRMGENRSFPHEDATKDFGYNPMPLSEGIKIEVEQYKRRKY
ncbi:SDR family oxidoreductase [Paenibacillus sp. NPDC056722]|uniref:SDR family oxidoreductase n=1 Tax=Paenibacillus sp. NPDC056722 TaxID=3345924 RepID=UPI0036737A3F